MNADKLLSDDDTLPSDDNDELGGLEYEQRRIGRAMALAMRCLGWAVAHDDRDLAKEHLDKIIALARELYAAENPPTRVEAAAENRRRAKARAEKKQPREGTGRRRSRPGRRRAIRRGRRRGASLSTLTRPTFARERDVRPGHDLFLRGVAVKACSCCGKEFQPTQKRRRMLCHSLFRPGETWAVGGVSGGKDSPAPDA